MSVLEGTATQLEELEVDLEFYLFLIMTQISPVLSALSHIPAWLAGA